MPKKHDELLERLDRIISLMEEQTHYLSLLLPDAEEEIEEPEPNWPEPPERLVALAAMLVDYCNANLERIGPPNRPRVILPHRISERVM